MYDVVIAGGGPAGATLARLISKKYKVLLLEKRDYSAGGSGAQEKCCGGLVDPDAQMMLAKFRLGIPKEVLLSPQLFAVRVIDIHNSIERYYQRHYINIDRRMYDKWLLSIIPDDCDVRTGCVFKSFESQGECIQVKYIQSGEEQITETRLLMFMSQFRNGMRPVIFRIFTVQYLMKR